MKYRKAKFVGFNKGEESLGIFTLGKEYSIKIFHEESWKNMADAFEITCDLGENAYCLTHGCAFGRWEMIE